MLALSRVAGPALLADDARSVSKTVARAAQRAWSRWEDGVAVSRVGAAGGVGGPHSRGPPSSRGSVPGPGAGSSGSCLVTVYPR